MNICVIGLGSMGRRRIRLLKKVKPESIIVGIDNNVKRVEAVRTEYKINCYSSIKDTNLQFDCAFVCTSPQSHALIIKECLNKNIHVFSEINLVSDLYDENIQLANEKEKILFLSSTFMYKQEMQFIDERVKQNPQPCVYQYHVGQYLPDWHPWDKLSDFFASHKNTNGCREYLAIELPWLQNVFGKIEKINIIKRKLTNLGLDFADMYLMQIEHENGNAGNFMVDVVSRQAVRHLEVVNENIYIRWDGTPDSLYEKDIRSGKFRQIQAGEYIHEKGYADFVNEYAYMKEIEEFFKVINGKKPVYGFEEDKETLRIIYNIEDADA